MTRTFFFALWFCIALFSCNEKSKVNNRTGYDEEPYIETPEISMGDAIPDEDIAEDDSMESSSSYFDPNTGLLNPAFQGADLELIKVQTPDKNASLIDEEAIDENEPELPLEFE